ILGRAELDELDLLDARVRVAPLRPHECGALFRLEVDDRVGAPGQELRWAGHARGGRDGLKRGHRYASTFTTKYRNGSETSTNWCGTPFGIASTSPSASACFSPPATPLARRSPGPTSRGSTICPPVTTVAEPWRTCMTSVTRSWYSTSPGPTLRPASIL